MLEEMNTRQSALGVLESYIVRLERNVRGLKLLKSIVEKETLKPQDESLLWELFLAMNK